MDVRRVVSPDAIESIDDPAFSCGYEGDSDDHVLVVEPADGPARAYPVTILNYHEIVNDVLEGGTLDAPRGPGRGSGATVEGEAVAVTWCPLCGSGVVYERSVDGRVLTFGVSGKLAEDDLVMYDRETESEWKQSTGECIAGPLEGESLAVRPATMTTAGRFEAAHPDGVVLDRPEGEHSVVVADESGGGLATERREIDYSVDHYEDYVEGDWIGSRSRERPRRWDRTDLAAKEVVLGLEADGDALGVPRSVVPEGGTLDVTVGGTDVVVLAADGELHAYEATGFAFDPVGDGRFEADGTIWDGATGQADDGRSLDRVPARRMFAFAWQADHGPDAFVRRE